MGVQMIKKDEIIKVIERAEKVRENVYRGIDLLLNNYNVPIKDLERDISFLTGHYIQLERIIREYK